MGQHFENGSKFWKWANIWKMGKHFENGPTFWKWAKFWKNFNCFTREENMPMSHVWTPQQHCSAMMTLPVVMLPYKAGHQVELFYKGGKWVEMSHHHRWRLFGRVLSLSTQNGLGNDDVNWEEPDDKDFNDVDLKEIRPQIMIWWWQINCWRVWSSGEKPHPI